MFQKVYFLKLIDVGWDLHTQEGNMKHSTNTTQKRLRVLGDDEIEAIYGIPRFTPYERQEYFSFSLKELAALEQLHSIKSQI